MVAQPIEITTALETRKGKVGRDGLGYIWTIDEPKLNRSIEIRIDYLSGRTEELHGEIEVSMNGSHLQMTVLNISRTGERLAFSRALEDQTSALNVPWAKYVEQFCVAVLRREREGEDVQYPVEMDARMPIVYVVDYLAIKGKTNVIFAPGGSGKGFLSIGMCCAVAAKSGLGDLSVLEGNPLYLDWEDDYRTFNDRLNAVAHGMNVNLPRIPYKRMRGLLSNKINEIARVVSDTGADLIVVDSVSAAAGTTDDKTAWDSVAHRLFDATDLIPDVTWLLVDHVVGGALKDPVGKAFGSIQKMNRVRNGWEMRSEQEPGSNISHMRMYDAKWNHTGHRPAIGMRLEFTDHAVTFYSEDPIDNTTLEANIPDKIADEIDRNGPKSIQWLANKLNVQEGSIRTALSRDQRQPLMTRRFGRLTGGAIRLQRDDLNGVVHEDDRPVILPPEPAGLLPADGSLPW